MQKQEVNPTKNPTARFDNEEIIGRNLMLLLAPFGFKEIQWGGTYV